MSSIGGFQRRTPKNMKSRRAIKKYESKVFENPKKILFLRGAKTSQTVTEALNDLAAITKPFNKKLKKRNAFHPFEGNQHLEFLGFKNDCSLFCFGSDSKKRPENIVMGRHFDFHVLDMIELGILAMDNLEMGTTKGESAGSIGSKPFFVFEGSEFESEPFFIRLKSLFMDFFHGSSETEINMDGVDRVIQISLKSNNGEDAVMAPSDDCVGTKPQNYKGNTVICFRHFALSKTQSATSRTSDPSKVQLTDIGPNFDFEVRRVMFAPNADFKVASRLPKEALAHMKGMHENIKADALGNLTGQLHVGKQDVTQLNLRRFKRSRGSGPETGASAPETDGEEHKKKRRRRESGGEDPTEHGAMDI